MWSLVVWLAAACVGSTVAIAPCSMYPDIPKQLSQFHECYVNHQKPYSLVGFGKLMTLAYISDDVLPGDIQCATGMQMQGVGYVNLTRTSGELVKLVYEQELKCNFIREKDSDGILYRIWPIRNQNHVYFYYRCLETKGQKGTGKPMAAIYVECGYVHNQEAKKEIETAVACAKKLQITNLLHKTPCDCQPSR